MIFLSVILMPSDDFFLFCLLLLFGDVVRLRGFGILVGLIRIFAFRCHEILLLKCIDVRAQNHAGRPTECAWIGLRHCRSLRNIMPDSAEEYCMPNSFGASRPGIAGSGLVNYIDR